jgi:hypothetical protein
MLLALKPVSEKTVSEKKIVPERNVLLIRTDVPTVLYQSKDHVR